MAAPSSTVLGMATPEPGPRHGGSARPAGQVGHPAHARAAPYRIAHTRHYYPDSKHRTGAPSTNKAVDAFAVLDGDRTIYVIWSCDLDPEQDDALPRLAREARRTAETRSRAIPLRQRAATTVRPPSAPHAGRAQCRGFS